METVAHSEWPSWEPTVSATLLFIISGGNVLLIHKKRGFGAGKINGPGGKIDPGETPLQCAVRETQEELGVTATNAEQAGEIFFEFADGMRLWGVIFRATEFEGEARETDEATPLWTPLDAVPYDKMWADDRHWLPHLLGGRKFRARFEFDGETLLSRRVEVVDEL